MRIGQLLPNLLGNALTHGANDQPVRVGASTAHGELVVAVSNGGAPIAPIARERLFQPFFRGHDRGRQGLGLGSHIASEIARLMAGRWWRVRMPSPRHSFSRCRSEGITDRMDQFASIAMLAGCLLLSHYSRAVPGRRAGNVQSSSVTAVMVVEDEPLVRMHDVVFSRTQALTCSKLPMPMMRWLSSATEPTCICWF
ncbi:sensor histidine kinase [Hephaestia sp. GCM10023244]|uniref:sensor histidine kinase n=1 Tax=unclassified Hephaestia TaxID=2631281 RepID=UPI00336C166E